MHRGAAAQERQGPGAAGHCVGDLPHQGDEARSLHTMQDLYPGANGRLGIPHRTRSLREAPAIRPRWHIPSG